MPRPRILGGGGASPSNTVGRPGGYAGLSYPSRAARGLISSGLGQSVRRLMVRDPAKVSGLVGTSADPVGVLSRAHLTTAMAGTHNDLKFQAEQYGEDGNDATIALVVAGNDTPLTIDVTGTDVVVNVATGVAGAVTSTATEVRDAVNADAAARAVLSAELATGNSGAGVVAAVAETALAGGYSAAKVAAGAQFSGPGQVGLNDASKGGRRTINTRDTRKRIRAGNVNRVLRKR